MDSKTGVADGSNAPLLRESSRTSSGNKQNLRQRQYPNTGEYRKSQSVMAEFNLLQKQRLKELKKAQQQRNIPSTHDDLESTGVGAYGGITSSKVGQQNREAVEKVQRWQNKNMERLFQNEDESKQVTNDGQHHNVGDARDASPPEKNTHSTIYMMLSSKSNTLLSRIFSFIISVTILVNSVGFVLSTVDRLDREYSYLFDVIEAVSSCIFLVEYTLRIIVVTEKPKYSDPILGRLRYMCKFTMIMDALSTFPYFVGLLVSQDLPTLSFLRIFRLFRILRNQSFIRAFESSYRVVYFNRHILLIAFIQCFFLMLMTSCLLYYFRPPKGGVTDANDFESLPATMYLSVLMLTGQGQPEGDNLPWYTKAIIVITVLFSIAQFAIPASMLTWGFEAEAERLVKKEHDRRMKIKELKAQGIANPRVQSDGASSSNWSDDDGSSVSTWSAYEDVILGLESDDDMGGETAEEKAAKDEKFRERVFNLFTKLDTDGSGQISVNELMDLLKELKDNQDLTIDEIVKGHEAKTDDADKEEEDYQAHILHRRHHITGGTTSLQAETISPNVAVKMMEKFEQRISNLEQKLDLILEKMGQLTRPAPPKDI